MLRSHPPRCLRRHQVDQGQSTRSSLTQTHQRVATRANLALACLPDHQTSGGSYSPGEQPGHFPLTGN
eukprot:2093073-Rhodomonas_salina.2